MNVGYVENVSEIGGAERMFEILLNGVRKRGIVPLITCPGPGKFPDVLRAQSFNVEYQPLLLPSLRHPIDTIKGYFAWSRLISAHGWSIVHTNNFHGARSVLPAAGAKRVPVICHVHFPFGRDYLRWVFSGVPKPAGFIFCSDDLRRTTGQLLQELYPASRQWVVHNGIDVTRFTPAETKNAVPRIGIIANLQERKGHDDFLNMAAILTRQGHDAMFDIIGGDLFQSPRQPGLAALARELGIDRRVVFHGQVANVRDLLAGLDIVVCASHEEAFPVSILEAMACAKPVVSTNVNGIPEAIEDGLTGLLVPPHNPEALAMAVARVLKDPELSRALAASGRARVEARFTSDHFVDGVVAAYGDALSTWKTAGRSA